MVDAITVALRLVRLYGPLALCLFAFLETSLLFPFLPSEVIVPTAAALLVTDPLSFLAFVTAAGIGGTVGAFVPFSVCYGTWLGELDWVRARVDVSDEQVERGRAWFRRWGQSSVLWGRFLPVVRSVISVPAGVANMDPLRFGVYTAVGQVGFYAAAGGLVYYGRRQSVFVAVLAVAADRPGQTAAVIVVLLGVGLLVRRWARERR